MNNKDNITIIINNQEYKIKCNEDEVDLLNRSAALLDIKIDEIKKNTPSMANDKASIMAGLNIASMYLAKEDKLKDFNSVTEELDDIQHTLKFTDDE